MNKEKVIFHIDVNSAFLSWEAVERIKQGEKLDIRTIPAIIGGDEKKRHGIVLAKSESAKRYGIVTGESIHSALKKYPGIIIVPPQHHVYKKYSEAMVKILEEYSPNIERYSIDECFIDDSYMKNLCQTPIQFAQTIKTRIKNELGFTVNIGISCNKLLAKMASDFQKPDKIHTLYPNEIKEKMWPLPIEDLFMVGSSTAKKLRMINIKTIGDLANSNIDLIKYKFKSYGLMVWNYANGIDNSEIQIQKDHKFKSISKESTVPNDIVDNESAYIIIMDLVENVSKRLRYESSYCRVISVTLKNSDFKKYSKQIKLSWDTDSTSEIMTISKKLFDQVWHGEPIRLIGVSLSDISDGQYQQISMFNNSKNKKQVALDKVVDEIRKKYGEESVVRSSLMK